MLGIGESEKELFETIKDIEKTGIDILTIGQYLAPTKDHYHVIKEYSEKEFENIRKFAFLAGIKTVVCGRYVRSSYLADEL